MAADLVPIRLSLSDGDRYTLWAPRWRDSGDEWEAFLGKDEDLYVFENVADLTAFVRSDSDNDLVDHPGWENIVEANAHKLDPDADKQFDLVAVEELVAEKPTEESVTALAGTLAIVSSIGSVCELPAISKFFNGNPTLGTVSGGIDHFTGKAGQKRWNAIAEIIGRSWDDVLQAIDEIATIPEFDEKLAAKAAEELEEEVEEEEVEEEEVEEEADDALDETDLETDSAETDDELDEAVEETDEDEDDEDEEDAEDDERAEGDTVVLGGDEEFWLQVGIDPIRIMTSSGTFYTLRCYLDDQPIFLGRNGRISVFSSERALARYLADEHDHDLSDLATYDDIRTAATDGSLKVDITDENVYVLSGLADDFADGPEAVDREQLDLAVELLRDIGAYSEESTVDKALDPGKPLGKLIGHVLEPESTSKPNGPYASAVRAWEKLEAFVESRLRRE
ncbi:primosomal protein [Mycobacterium asiaticum]|uniref:Primosomal protein n=1 Tax=Mycobacterium asiaticum TaxID=1790 RepID=A0A1A3P2X1_MYCAS|nr:primosomal protein [Mycobacterium asiaticum]OBK28598.1 primosomal protein [Mycobacterium asiaticum]